MAPIREPESTSVTPRSDPSLGDGTPTLWSASARGLLGVYALSVVEVLVPWKTELWGSTFRAGLYGSPLTGSR